LLLNVNYSTATKSERSARLFVYRLSNETE
jgi:hypothetical protein